MFHTVFSDAGFSTHDISEVSCSAAVSVPIWEVLNSKVWVLKRAFSWLDLGPLLVLQEHFVAAAALVPRFPDRSIRVSK